MKIWVKYPIYPYEEIGTEIGKTLGNFYKKLINSGVSKDEALAMTKEYLSTLTKITSNFK